jgi:hypothetical protein
VRPSVLVLALFAMAALAPSADAGPRERARPMPAIRVDDADPVTAPSIAAPTLAGPLITITRVQDMGFGKVVASATAGTVTLATNGTRTAAGGTTLANGASAKAAQFTVAAAALLLYNITLPSSSTLTSSGHTMTVDTFTSNPSGTGQIGAGGTSTLLVGGKLHVGASQASGSYSGTFNVTVVLP